MNILNKIELLSKTVKETVEEIKHQEDVSITIMCGDADEYYMDAYPGDERDFVWITYPINNNTVKEKLVAKFNNWESAQDFAKDLYKAFNNVANKEASNIVFVTLI